MSAPSDGNYHLQAAAIVGQLLANDPRTPGAETALQAFLHADWNVQLIVTGSLAGIIHERERAAKVAVDANRRGRATFDIARAIRALPLEEP